MDSLTVGDRLIARDSGWLTLLPEVVVQDELRLGLLVSVARVSALQERFYAITAPRRQRHAVLEDLLARAETLALEAASPPSARAARPARAVRAKRPPRG